MKVIYQNSYLRAFILDNGRYRIEARNVLDPTQYTFYVVGDTLPQALARMEGRCEALRNDLDELQNIGCKKALAWCEKHEH